MKDHLFNLLENFVINNNFKINSEDFKLQLISNPSFPSVKSISDTLDYFGLENIVANVPKDAIDQLPKYFLAVLQTETSSTIAQVQQLNNNTLKLFKDDGKKERISTSDFKELWNGTIIAVERNDSEEKASSFLSLKNSLIPLAVLLVSALGYSLINLEPQGLIYTLLACLGIGIGYFVVRESLGLHNEVTSKICNSTSINTSCSEVINSNSKLFGLVSLSDATITFFVAITLIISLFGYNPSFSLGLSLMSIPIIFYSLYSQAFVIKKWCPLCLGIVGVLVAQLINALAFTNTLEFNVIYLIKSIVLAITFYLSWIYAKEILIKAIKQKQLQTEFLKFKRNETLFSTLLYKKKISSSDALNPSCQITFGNPNAALEFTSVTNPLCGFCTKAFESYDSLLKTHREKIKLHIVFNVSSETIDNPDTQISQRIIEIYQENREDAYNALKDWFANRDVDMWLLKYNKPTKTSNYQTLTSHYKWCSLKEINYTPATLVGNYFFPKEYEIKDFAFFIDYLIEKQKNTISNTVSKQESSKGSITHLKKEPSIN